MIEDKIANFGTFVASCKEQIIQSATDKKSSAEAGKHSQMKVQVVQDIKQQLQGLQNEMAKESDFSDIVPVLERMVKKLPSINKLTAKSVHEACDMVSNRLVHVKTLLKENGLKDNPLYQSSQEATSNMKTKLEDEEMGMSVSFGSEDSDSIGSSEGSNSDFKIVGKNGDLYSIVDKSSSKKENSVSDHDKDLYENVKIPSDYENVKLPGDEKLSPEQLRCNLLDNPVRTRFEVFNLIKNYPEKTIGSLMKSGASKGMGDETLLAIRTIHCLKKVLSSDFSQQGISEVLTNHVLYKSKTLHIWKGLADKFISENPKNENDAVRIAYKFMTYWRTE